MIPGRWPAGTLLNGAEGVAGRWGPTAQLRYRPGPLGITRWGAGAACRGTRRLGWKGDMDEWRLRAGRAGRTVGRLDWAAEVATGRGTVAWRPWLPLGSSGRCSMGAIVWRPGRVLLWVASSLGQVLSWERDRWDGGGTAAWEGRGSKGGEGAAEEAGGPPPAWRLGLPLGMVGLRRSAAWRLGHRPVKLRSQAAQRDGSFTGPACAQPALVC